MNFHINDLLEYFKRSVDILSIVIVTVLVTSLIAIDIATTLQEATSIKYFLMGAILGTIIFITVIRIFVDI